MRLNSKVVGIIVLVVMFGGILLTADLGWWQTESGGRGAGNHDRTNESAPDVLTLHGRISSYDQRRLTITADDGQSLYIELGNSRYNRSIGFSPQVGERVTVEAFIPGIQDSYSAITVTLENTGQIYTFRDALGHPLWAGKNAN